MPKAKSTNIVSLPFFEFAKEKQQVVRRIVVMGVSENQTRLSWSEGFAHRSGRVEYLSRRWHGYESDHEPQRRV
jgi:hypothetical protein